CDWLLQSPTSSYQMLGLFFALILKSQFGQACWVNIGFISSLSAIRKSSRKSAQQNKSCLMSTTTTLDLSQTYAAFSIMESPTFPRSIRSNRLGKPDDGDNQMKEKDEDRASRHRIKTQKTGNFGTERATPSAVREKA